MGASPDGIVNCVCCGKGVLEIKCPYSCVDKLLLNSVFSLMAPSTSKLLFQNPDANEVLREPIRWLCSVEGAGTVNWENPPWWAIHWACFRSVNQTRRILSTQIQASGTSQGVIATQKNLEKWSKMNVKVGSMKSWECEVLELTGKWECPDCREKIRTHQITQWHHHSYSLQINSFSNLIF